MWRGWRGIGLAKRVYAEKCAGSRSVGRTRKRCIDNVKEILKKKKRVGCQANEENGAG